MVRLLTFACTSLTVAASLTTGVLVAAPSESLARLVLKALPEFKGRIEMKAVRLGPRAVLDLATDAPTPIVIEGLRVTDPEGTLVLAAPRLDVKVKLRSAMAGKVYLYDLTLGPGSFWRFAKMKRGGAIGFTQWFLPKPKGTPRAAPAGPARPPPADERFRFEIVSARLDGFTAQFDFPGAWGLELRDIKAPASFLLQEEDRGSFVGWDVPGLEARAGGYLRIKDEVLPFDRVLVNRVATLRSAPNDIFLDVGAAHTGRTVLRGKGSFTGIYGYGGDSTPSGMGMRAELTNALDALVAVARPHGLAGLALAGNDVRVSAELKGLFESADPQAKAPTDTLRIDGSLDGLDVSFGGRAARRLGLAFGFAVGPPLSVTVQRLGFDVPGGGRVALTAGLRDTAFELGLRLDKATLDAYLPPGLQTLLGGTIDGRLDARGDFGQDRQRVTVKELDLTLTRRTGAGLPKKARVTGDADATPNRVLANRLRVEVPGAAVNLGAEAQLVRRRLALSLRAVASNLPLLLQSLGLPPLGRTAEASIVARGGFDAPSANGTAVVRGIHVPPLPGIPEVRARWTLDAGALRLEALEAAAFGGRFDAHGSVRLFDQTLDRVLALPVVELRLDGKQIDVGALLSAVMAPEPAKAPGATASARAPGDRRQAAGPTKGRAASPAPGPAAAPPPVTGRVDLRARVSGPTDKLRATITLPAGAELVILGEPWSLGGIEIEAGLDEAVLRSARLHRPGGGEVDVSGRFRFTGEGSFAVNVRDFPLAALPGLTGLPIEGRLGARLEGGGTVERPTVRGTIDLSGVKAQDSALGGATLTLATDPDGAVRVRGDLFRRFAVEARAAFGPKGPSVRANLRFDRLVLEELLPQLAELGDARGLLSGQVDLALAPGGTPEVDLTLGQLELSVARPAGANTAAKAPTPRIGGRLALRSLRPVRARVRGERITLDEVLLGTDGGQLKLRGALEGSAVEGAVEGTVDLALLRPFLAGQIDSLTGSVRVALTASGALPRPQLEGSVAITSPIVARLAGLEPELRVPSMQLLLAPGEVRLRDLALSAEGSTVSLGGAIRFDEQFAPRSFDVRAAGELSARLLETLAAGAITEASGKVRLDARAEGTFEDPQVAARVDLARVRLRLRGLDHELEVQSGTLELSPREILLRDVRAIVDGQGQLLVGAGGVEPGRITLRGLLPRPEIAAIRLPLQGRGLSFASPGTVILDDLNFGLLLTGNPTDGLALNGEVRVASGRYVQDFTMRAFVITPSVNESAGRARGEANPLIDDLALDLRLRTIGDSFTVQNNLAPELHMILDLHVGGTLARPQIAGDVRPTDGRFHIIGLRGDFVLTPNVNHVTFVGTRSIASGDTPELNLEAEDLVTDSAGREHTVRMRITGPIGQARIDLSSDTGLDRNQTMLLLLSGRTTDARSAAFGPNVGTGTDIVGQIARDSVADFLEPYIDDTLQALTGRKLNLRPTVGPDGFELRLGARVSRQLDLQLSFLRGFQAQRRYRAEGNVWLMDYVSLRGFGQQLTLEPQQGIVEQVSSLNLELTLDLPLRLGGP